MQKNFTKATAKNKKVTLMPGWLLKFKGRIDSIKGSGVCDEYLLKLSKKEAVIEATEIIKAENYLAESRKAGAKTLVLLSEKKEAVSENSGRKLDSDFSRATIVQHRENRKAARSLIEELSQINETIVFVDAVLNERIEKVRNQAEEKCHAYISGVRAGKLKDYESPVSGYDSNTLDIYYKKHESLDTKIRDVVNNSIKEVF